jgi:hypothetical protein
MCTSSKDIDRSTVPVVAGVIDKLVVERKSRRLCQRVAVISLDILLEAIVGQLPIPYQDAESARVEERDVVFPDAVGDAGAFRSSVWSSASRRLVRRGLGRFT